MHKTRRQVSQNQRPATPTRAPQKNHDTTHHNIDPRLQAGLDRLVATKAQPDDIVAFVTDTLRAGHTAAETWAQTFQFVRRVLQKRPDILPYLEPLFANGTPKSTHYAGLRYPKAQNIAQLVTKYAPRLGLEPAAITVRLDAEAESQTRRHDAAALADNQTIFLDPNRFREHDIQSQQTLAHELVHIAQRTSAAPKQTYSHSKAEYEAYSIGHQVVSGRTVTPTVALPSHTIAADNPRSRDEADQHEPTYSLPDGVNYQVTGTSAILRKSWVAEGAHDVQGGTQNVAAFTVLLNAMRANGSLPWLTPDLIDHAARHLVLQGGLSNMSDVFLVEMSMSAYQAIGLPPGTPFRWYMQGQDLRVLFSGTVFTSGGVTTDGVVRVASGPLFRQLFENIAQRTRLPLQSTATDAFFADLSIAATETDVQNFQAIDRRIPIEMLRTAFGADAWNGWVDRSSHTLPDPEAAPLDGGAMFDAGISAEDQEFARRFWEQLRGEQPEPQPGQTPPANPVTVSQLMIDVWREIDAHPQKDRILQILRGNGRGGSAQPLTSRDYRNLIRQVEIEQIREQMNLTLNTANDPDWRPIVNEPVQGHLVNDSDLLYAGKEGRFHFEVDDRADAFRVPVVTIRWVVTPAAEPQRHLDQETTRYGELDGPEFYEFEFENVGTYRIHAFVSHNFYLSNYFSMDVEVTTEQQRLGELTSEAFNGFGTVSRTEAHEYDTALLDEVGADRFQHGYRSFGQLPDDFQVRTFDQRLEYLRREIARIQAFIADHESSGSGRDRDMVRYARTYLETLERTETQLQGEHDSGAIFFDIRGAYVSRTPGAQSRPLQLVANCRRVDNEVQVVIHDHTQAFEPENFRFEKEEDTFSEAVEEAFLALCKAYPNGRMSVRVEKLTEDGTARTREMLGFELDCGSSWESIRTDVLGPMVSLIVNIVGAATMIFFPVTASVILPALIVYNGTETISRLIEEGERGTLTTMDVVRGVALIGMDLLPYLGRASRLMSTSSRTIFLIEGVQLAGMSVVVTSEALEQLEHLRNGLVRQVAELEEQIQLLEQTNRSDPRLPELRRRRDTLVEQARTEGERLFARLATQQGIMLLGGHIVQRLGQERLGARVADLTRGGAIHEVPGARPHYDPETGRIVLDPMDVTDAQLTTLMEARATDLSTRRRQVGDLLGQRDVDFDFDPQLTTTSVRQRPDGGYEVRVPPGRRMEDVLDDVWAHRNQGTPDAGARPTTAVAGTEPDPHFTPTYDMATVRGQTNVAVGNRLHSEAEAHDVLRRLAAGDADALRAVGLDRLPDDFPTHSVEWGIAELPDGQFAIVRGESGAVDWGHFPGARPVAHSHPAQVHNQMRNADGHAATITFDSLVRGGTEQAGRNLVHLFPSGADISFCARNGLSRHTVHTPFQSLGRGRIGNPGSQAGAPTIDFEILRPQHAGNFAGTEIPVYRAEVVARANGEEIWRGTVYSPDIPALGSVISFDPPPITAVSPQSGGRTRGGTTPTGSRRPVEEVIDVLNARIEQIQAARGDINTFRARFRTVTADGNTARPLSALGPELNTLLTPYRRMRTVTGGGRRGTGVSTYIESLDGQFSIRITHNQVGDAPVGNPPEPRIHVYQGPVSGHGAHLILPTGTSLADILNALR